MVCGWRLEAGGGRREEVSPVVYRPSTAGRKLRTGRETSRVSTFPLAHFEFVRFVSRLRTTALPLLPLSLQLRVPGEQKLRSDARRTGQVAQVSVALRRRPHLECSLAM